MACEILHSLNYEADGTTLLGSGPRPLTRSLKEIDWLNRTVPKFISLTEGLGVLVSNFASSAAADHRIHTPTHVARVSRSFAAVVMQHLDNHRDREPVNSRVGQASRDPPNVVVGLEDSTHPTEVRHAVDHSEHFVAGTDRLRRLPERGSARAVANTARAEFTTNNRVSADKGVTDETAKQIASRATNTG